MKISDDMKTRKSLVMRGGHLRQSAPMSGCSSSKYSRTTQLARAGGLYFTFQPHILEIILSPPPLIQIYMWRKSTGRYTYSNNTFMKLWCLCTHFHFLTPSPPPTLFLDPTATIWWYRVTHVQYLFWTVMLTNTTILSFWGSLWDQSLKRLSLSKF